MYVSGYIFTSEAKIKLFLWKKFLPSADPFGAASFENLQKKLMLAYHWGKQYGFPKLHFFQVLAPHFAGWVVAVKYEEHGKGQTSVISKFVVKDRPLLY